MSKPAIDATFENKVLLFSKAIGGIRGAGDIVYKEALEQPLARGAAEACLRLARGLDTQPDESKVCLLVQ